MPARAFIRHRRDIDADVPYRYLPLTKDHPCYRDKCLVCGEQLGDGTSVRLRANPTGLDAEESYKYNAGKWFTSPADIIHDRCARTRASIEKGQTVTVVRDV